MTQWDEKRRELLRSLKNIGATGRSEGEAQERIVNTFYPIPEHLRLLDPDTVLVVGPRGSGKTNIVRILTDGTQYDAVSKYAQAVRLPTGSSTWVKAHPMERGGFEPIGLRSFIENRGNQVERLQDLWFAYLVRSLSEKMTNNEKSGLEAILSPRGAKVTEIVDAFGTLDTQPVVALDSLDERLESENQFIFVTYDEIDTLGGNRWDLVEAGASGLVSFWATYARRWRRIRAKIFLRTDLYEKHAKSGGADLAKLAAGRVDLFWSDRDLYGLLLKRLMNADEKFSEYMQEKNFPGVSWHEDNVLGKIPQLRTWKDARPFVERMVGKYMGKNQQKGLVYSWLLAHVRDGLGRAFPRPFIRLIEEAAQQELNRSGTLRWPRLLHPSSLRRALDLVSAEHITNSRDEWKWLELVKAKLAKDPLVPWNSARKVIGLLNKESADDDKYLFPFDGREFLDHLLELGVLRQRPDGRIDATDLFLAGLKLKRKGGVGKGGAQKSNRRPSKRG